MSEETNTVLALKNAWNGAVAASNQIRDLGPAVQALAEEAALNDLDLETYHRATLAQSNAVLALRGLVEELRRKRGDDA